MNISELTIDEVIALLTASVCAMKSTQSVLYPEQEVTEENYQKGPERSSQTHAAASSQVCTANAQIATTGGLTDWLACHSLDSTTVD